ncbi:hypothetical protein JST97_29575 [bacterium]|nr:hypothetical protein [bacterium]
MRRYRELDDSPEDYDPRPGQVMLAQDVIRGGKVQASQEGATSTMAGNFRKSI